jgi:hypothetical protein
LNYAAKQLGGVGLRRQQPDVGEIGVSSVVAGQQFTTPRQVRVGARFEL